MKFNVDRMNGINDYERTSRVFMVSLAVLLVIMLSGLAVRCQTIKETLPDGSLIIDVGGIEYRAFSASKMRELASTKARADSYLELQKSFDQYKADSLAKSRLKDAEWGFRLQQEQNKTSFYKDQLEKEKEYSTNLRKTRPLCSPKILIFKICV